MKKTVLSTLDIFGSSTKMITTKNVLYFIIFYEKVSRPRWPPGGGYLTREVTGVCGKALHTLYPVA